MGPGPPRAPDIVGGRSALAATCLLAKGRCHVVRYGESARKTARLVRAFGAHPDDRGARKVPGFPGALRPADRGEGGRPGLVRRSVHGASVASNLDSSYSGCAPTRASVISRTLGHARFCCAGLNPTPEFKDRALHICFIREVPQWFVSCCSAQCCSRLARKRG